MAVQFIATGISANADVATPFANQSYTLPTGHAAKDLLLAFYGGKPYDTVPSTPTDYTVRSGGANGSTAMGAGSGSVYAAVFSKVHDGSESNPASTFSAQYSPAVRAMLLLRDHDSSNNNWTVTSTNGSDTDATGTSFSATGASNLSYTTGDIVVVLLVHNDDSSSDSSFGITISGCTVGTVTQQLTGTLTTSTGNDARMYVLTAEITSGTSSAAPQVTATTGSGDSDGQAVFLRVQRPTRDALASALVDQFSALTAWPASHADITVSGGKAVLPVKSTYPAMKTNEDKYFDSVFAEIQLPTAAGNGTKQVLFDVVQQDSGDYAMFQIDGSAAGATIGCHHRLATVESSSTGITWSATDHKYLRLRVDGTTVYWDRSPDSVDWTNMWSKAGHTPSGLGRQTIRLYAGYYGTETETTAWVESVNCVSGSVTAPDAEVTVAALAPTVTGTSAGGGATVTVPDPALVDTTAKAPSLTGGAKVTSVLTNVSTTAKAPTVTASAATTVPDPAEVSVTAKAPTVTGTRFATVVTPAAAVTAASPTPTVTGGATVVTPPATVTTAAPAPTATAGAALTATPATVTAAAPAPTVVGTIFAVVLSVPATVTAAAPAPTVTGGTGVIAPPAAVTASAVAPSLAGGATVAATPGTVTADGTAPVVTGGATTQPPAATVSVAAPAPAVSAAGGSTVEATAAAVSVTAGTPTVTAGGTVTATPATVTAAAPAPAVTATRSQTVTATPAAVTVQAASPVVAAAAIVTATTATVTITAVAPSPTAGASAAAATVTITAVRPFVWVWTAQVHMTGASSTHGSATATTAAAHITGSDTGDGTTIGGTSTAQTTLDGTTAATTMTRS